MSPASGAEATAPAIGPPGMADGAPRIPRDGYLFGLSIFLLIAATNILTPLLPAIRDEFEVSIAAAGLVVGSYGLARLSVDLPAGWLAAKVGERRLSILALAVLVVASIIGLAASRIEILIVSRIGSGMAVGILATVALAGLSSTASAANRGKVMSLFHVANNFGIAFYPMLGGIIGVVIGWRATFVVTGVLACVAAVIFVPLLLRTDFGTGTVNDARKADESRVLHGRERARAVAATNYGVVANMVHRHGVRNTILPLYAATSLGLGGISIATAIALMSITGLIVATPGGALGDRIGRRRVITAGLAAIAVGDLVFLLTGDVVTFLIAAALIGFGDFFTSSQTALLSEVVPPVDRTKILATYRFSADLGALIGPVALAIVMEAAGAQAAILLAVAILLSASMAARLLVPSPTGTGEPAANIQPGESLVE